MNAVVTIHGTCHRIPCFTKDELDYYTKRLRVKGNTYTIYYFNNLDQLTDFVERGTLL